MILSMIGVGIAWASILAMPYAILSDSLPAAKMGTYMGIFNFFITIPQITNGVIHGWIVRHVYEGHAVFALLTGGVFLLLAALSVSFVKLKKGGCVKIGAASLFCNILKNIKQSPNFHKPGLCHVKKFL